MVIGRGGFRNVSTGLCGYQVCGEGEGKPKIREIKTKGKLFLKVKCQLYLSSIFWIGKFREGGK